MVIFVDVVGRAKVTCVRQGPLRRPQGQQQNDTVAELNQGCVSHVDDLRTRGSCYRCQCGQLRVATFLVIVYGRQMQVYPNT